MQQLQAAYRDLQIVAIDIQERPETVVSWTATHQVTLPVLLDPDGRVTKAYGVSATPTVFVLDRTGRLVGKALGTKPWTSERGRLAIEKLLAS
ncbi:MAG: TlpA family protein disulfide reductase [Candidatus Rokubacteria bacterium]|nr:TlpA family protein disulfide reductase [Candidatus Rokubacteria bacterium]MBI3826676.1 TlpA family protein disulfide reductase [Candidatus Rokubacteria bacterium]